MVAVALPEEEAEAPSVDRKGQGQWEGLVDAAASAVQADRAAPTEGSADRLPGDRVDLDLTAVSAVLTVPEAPVDLRKVVAAARVGLPRIPAVFPHRIGRPEQSESGRAARTPGRKPSATGGAFLYG